MQWNTIESCPLETPVLVVANGVTQFCVLQRFEDGSWCALNEDDPFEDFNPTHWMLLPEWLESAK